jgi:hypothetical protein
MRKQIWQPCEKSLPTGNRASTWRRAVGRHGRELPPPTTSWPVQRSAGRVPASLVQCRPHLDVVLRELISRLQARAQRIDEAPMPRFRSPVDLHEKVLVLLQTARTAFLGTVHWLALQVCRNSAVSGSNGLKEMCFSRTAAKVGPAAWRHSG